MQDRSASGSPLSTDEGGLASIPALDGGARRPDNLPVRSIDLDPSSGGALVGASELVVLRGRLRGPASLRDLPSGWSPSAPRVLFRACRAAGWPDELPNGRHLSRELGLLLIRCGVSLVGIEAESIDPPGGEEEGCGALFRDRGVLVLTELDLGRLPPGRYGLVAWPEGKRALLIDPLPDGWR
jgi:kynurenine formamidase